MPNSSTPAATPGLLRSLDPAVALVSAGCIVLILAGSLANPAFLSIGYLLQQLQIASFLGIIATGAMLVILLGEIDLSVPLTITSTAIVATQIAGNPSPGIALLAIPSALIAGALIGLVNGLGVAIFRLPGIVWTLATNAMLLGATVFYTGGFKPQGKVPATAIWASHANLLGIPMAFLVWVVIGALTVWLLKGTVYGTYIYAAGNSQRALFMAGAHVRRVTVVTFIFAGVMSSLGSMLLTGYANQAYQGMGDPYLLPVIAAVVVGGTSILGGQGRYAGTVVGALFITLLASILSVLQISDGFRQICYGAIILFMLLVHRQRERG